MVSTIGRTGKLRKSALVERKASEYTNLASAGFSYQPPGFNQ
jgi:hypothetical protein